MLNDYTQFERYFRSKTEPLTAFQPDAQDEKTHLYGVSLSSLFNLAAWTDGLINNALFVTINEFAMFCFAQKKFFPEIGEAKAESSPQPLDGYAPGLWLLQHTQSGGRVTDEHSRHLIPKCSTRYVQSIYLAQLMTRFVWLHELAHCNNGHVSFVQDRKIADRIHELDDGLQAAQLSRRGNKTNLKVLKLLEFDADGSALKASLRIQTDGLENIDGIAKQALDTRIDLALFAAYAMTWLFEEIQAYLDVRAGLTHPSPFDRLQNLFHITSQHLGEHIPNIEDRRESAFKRFDTVRDAIPKIFCTEAITSRLTDDIEIARATQLNSKLEALRTRLQPFSFFSSPNES